MAQTINEKLDSIYAVKKDLKQAIAEKGIPEEEVGNDLKQYPAKVRKISVIEEAPVDGKAYLRKDGKWIPIKRGSSRALFESAGAIFNEQTDLYELNGLTDITENQMTEIYNSTNGFTSLLTQTFLYSGRNIRTNIKSKVLNSGNYPIELSYAYYNCKSIEIVDFGGMYIGKAESSFSNCFSLREILGFNAFVTLFNEGTFNKCSKLAIIEIANLSSDLFLQDARMLEILSLQKIIEKARKKDLTITLHPDVYSKAIADRGVQDALIVNGSITLSNGSENYPPKQA